jgi:DNA-binding GntR family transcriptional regulator
MTTLPRPTRAPSLSGQLFQILKEAIFAGKFKPGEALRELQLARTMNVSQATVREALTQLEQAGLVTRTATRRTLVTNFTENEVRDRLSMRIALEEVAFVKAAPHLTPRDFTALDKLAAGIDHAIRKRDVPRAALADMRFHRFVWEKTGSPVMLRTLDHLTTSLFAFLSVLHHRDLHDVRKTRSHRDLVDALRSRKPAMIRAAIRTHISDSYREFLANE